MRTAGSGARPKPVPREANISAPLRHILNKKTAGDALKKKVNPSFNVGNQTTEPSETAHEFYLRSLQNQTESNMKVSQNRRFKKPLTANRASRESLDLAPEVENFVTNVGNNRLNIN